jgi:hypothetical protein
MKFKKMNTVKGQRRRTKGKHERREENSFRAGFCLKSDAHNPRTAVVCAVCILEQDLWFEHKKPNVQTQRADKNQKSSDRPQPNPS